MGENLNPLTIIDWAYETTPETGILAGDGLGIDLPPHLNIQGVDNVSALTSVTLTITATQPISGLELSVSKFGWQATSKTKQIMKISILAFIYGLSIMF